MITKSYCCKCFIDLGGQSRKGQHLRAVMFQATIDSNSIFNNNSIHNNNGPGPSDSLSHSGSAAGHQQSDSFNGMAMESANGGGANNFKPSPSSSTSSCFCRICHEGDGSEPLVAPCKCTGTVALIHTSCLEHWLTASNSELCEICKFSYRIVKEPRSCTEYLKDSSNQFNVRNLIADIICFFLLTPLLVLSTYLCVLGANEYFLRERWEAVGLVILSLFLLGVYFTWCHVTVRFHISMWKSWQRTNQQIRLVEVPPSTSCHRRNRLMSPLGNRSRNNSNERVPFTRQASQLTGLDDDLDYAETRRILIV